MDNSVDFCSLCLKYNSNLKNVKWLDEDGKMVQEKLTSFLPECMLMETEISVFICNDCLQVINNTLTFRKQCLDNVNILKEYVQKLKAVDNSSTYLSLRLPDILYYKQYKTSQAKFSTDSPESKIETPQNSTDNKDIENIVVKVENTSDGEDYMKEEINEEYNIKDEEMQDNFVDCNVIIKTETEETSEDKRGNDNSNIALMPTKSGSVYQAAYERFIRWCNDKNITTYSENVLLTYFAELAANRKSSTMWSQYSMIKSLLVIKHDTDISKYFKLRTFLRKQNKGYIPKKSGVFSKEQFERFLTEAPDDQYLALKVILIIGISGACRCDEIVKMTIDQIEDHGSSLHIKVPDSNPDNSRSFTVVGENYLNIYRKYLSLRPKGMAERRLFLKYENKKCFRLVMGVHTISKVPRVVASYLKLPHADEFTGHSIRRTSAILQRR